jgi:hypothetical protein
MPGNQQKPSLFVDLRHVLEDSRRAFEIAEVAMDLFSTCRTKYPTDTLLIFSS